MPYPASRFIGALLLVVGTSIGAGMLALPVITANIGFFNSIAFLLGGWLIMTTGALLILEVNLRLKKGSNMASMALETLGKQWQVFIWFCYLLFLYTLLSAYISGGGDVLQDSLSLVSFNVSDPVSEMLFTLLLSSIVYKGISWVDYSNRALMFGKLGILIFLIIFISPNVSLPRLASHQFYHVSSTAMVLITSFGFASIVPSLRAYLDDDVKQIRKAIIIGSLIPLVSYIAWDAVLMGVIPQENLMNIAGSSHMTTELTHKLSMITNNKLITIFFRSFAAICMLTAFLGVSISLFDFISDGLKLDKTGKQGLMVFSLTFFPPLTVVLFFPDAYLSALKIAGFMCVFLLLFIPTIMAYISRYKLNLTNHQVIGGKPVLILISVTAFLIMALSLNDMLNPIK